MGEGGMENGSGIGYPVISNSNFIEPFRYSEAPAAGEGGQIEMFDDRGELAIFGKGKAPLEFRAVFPRYAYPQSLPRSVSVSVSVSSP